MSLSKKNKELLKRLKSFTPAITKEEVTRAPNVFKGSQRLGYLFGSKAFKRARSDSGKYSAL